MTYSFPKDFTAPVLALTTLGENDARVANWPNYKKFGLTPEHIPELIRVLEKVGEFWPDEPTKNEPEVYAPIHAWRALAQFKAEQAIPALFDVILWNEENGVDWIMEEVPDAIGMIGPACIPPLHNYLVSPEKTTWASVTMAHSLAEIGKQHPQSRTDCANALLAGLEQYETNDETINGFLISYLTDLKAIESVPLVERVYQAGMVDLSVLGDFEDFKEWMGLTKKRSGLRQPFHVIRDLDDIFAAEQSEPSPQTIQEKKEQQKTKKEKKARKRHKKKSF
ncbi:MAG: DUF1186 domain-containing protein [Anaerolineales bacterium]|jgi:hypothetical protein|nr:DUF1186 domain-containing protein [Anaerolineales bacterium]